MREKGKEGPGGRGGTRALITARRRCAAWNIRWREGLLRMLWVADWFDRVKGAEETRIRRPRCFPHKIGGSTADTQ